MNDVWDQFTPTQATRRDQWQRYKVLPPDGGKPAGYTRATTIAKILDDQSNLIGWSARMAAFGLVDRPDLLSAFAAVDRDDRKACNELVDRAKEAGGATIRRDLGTTLHSILERYWTEPDYEVPAIHRGDVTAVYRALQAAGLEPVTGLHERIVVDDRHQIAGMPDLFLKTRDGNVMVADVKTGASIAYGQLAFAIQLAIYANANNLYTQGAAEDGSEDRRHVMPAIDRNQAVIIHVEPGSNTCTLHRLDIEIGAQALELALAVKKMRATKKVLVPLEADVAPNRREWVHGRVTEIVANPAQTVDGWSAADLLARSWPDGVPTFKQTDTHTDAQLDAISALCDEVEATMAMPFPADTDPAIVEAAQGIPGDNPTILELQARAQALPADLLADVKTTSLTELKIPRLTSGKATVAQVAQVYALIATAEVEQACRIDLIDMYATETGIGPNVLIALVCTDLEQLDIDPAKPTATDVKRVTALADAHTAGYVDITTGTVEATDRCVDLLTVLFDSKAKALNAAKRLAKAQDLDVPRTFIDLLDDPLLIAFTVGDVMRQDVADTAA